MYDRRRRSTFSARVCGTGAVRCGSSARATDCGRTSPALATTLRGGVVGSSALGGKSGELAGCSIDAGGCVTAETDDD